MTTFLCLDIGGTKLKSALADEEGNLTDKQTSPTPAVAEAFTGKIQSLVGQYKEQISGIAISTPGTVDPVTQRLRFGGMLPFLDGISFSNLLCDFDLPIHVENDGKAAALAEVWQGSLKGTDTGAVIVLGTAVGGGIIINHRLHYGLHAQAGEFSFMMTRDPAGGDEKMVAHNSSAVEMVQAMNQAAGNVDLLDGQAAFASAASGNQAALAVLDQCSLNLAQLILNIQTIIDGDRVAIGGGVSAQPLLLDRIKAAYERLTKSPAIIGETLTKPEIVAAKFRNDANLLGALYGLLQNTNFDLKEAADEF
ncbi:ROK family protein [Lactobacillus sp.]|uniref:ROK family protein n=1 Tax=Lactobacillus sp. TaxID=1591 RepID=UPI003EFC05BC